MKKQALNPHLPFWETVPDGEPHVFDGRVYIFGGHDRLNGNNHGGLVRIGDGYYIFGHRHTHGTAYSRQGVAEKITMNADGTFRQAELTSCGLNRGPLAAEGVYSAHIAYHLTGPDRFKAGNAAMSSPDGGGHGMKPFIRNLRRMTSPRSDGGYWQDHLLKNYGAIHTILKEKLPPWPRGLDVITSTSMAALKMGGVIKKRNKEGMHMYPAA